MTTNFVITVLIYVIYVHRHTFTDTFFTFPKLLSNPITRTKSTT